jgi:hypothetical protein
MRIDVKDYRDHTNFWLTLFQSGSKITDREKSVLIEVLVKREELSRDGISEPYLTKLLFDTESRKEYCESLEISSFSLTNSLSALKAKGVLGEDFSVLKRLIPAEKLEFNFRYV